MASECITYQDERPILPVQIGLGGSLEGVGLGVVLIKRGRIGAPAIVLDSYTHPIPR